MRILLIAVIVAAAGWSGYWMISSRGVENDLRDWLDQRADAGWIAEYGDVSTQGFPNRFDTTVTDLDLADPASGIAWTAPFFQLLRLSYQPNHLIAIWPASQTIATPQQRISVQTSDARASLVFKSGTNHEVERISAVFTDVQLSSTAGWTADMPEARLATRPSDRMLGGIDVALQATNLHPRNAGLDRLAATDLLPKRLDLLKFDAALRFDAPWDQAAIEGNRPQVTAMDLRLLQATWGKLDLWAAGDLSFDDLGRASGSITIKAKNWQEILQIGVAAGWVPERFAGTLESGLSLLSSLAGSPKTLDAPLSFDKGKVSFGPIKLGTLPPLR